MSLMFDKSESFFTEKETGKNGISIRELANLTGVSHTALNSWIEKILAQTARLPKYFVKFIEKTELIYFVAEQEWKKGEAKILSAEFADKVLAYYADGTPKGAGKRCTEQAIETRDITNFMGFTKYIYDKTGYEEYKGDRTPIIKLDENRMVTEHRLAALEEDIKLYEHHLMREKEATQYYSSQVDVQLELKEGWKEKYEDLYREYTQLIAQMRREQLRITEHAEKTSEIMDSTWVEIYLSPMIRKLVSDIKLHNIFYGYLSESIQAMEVLCRMTPEEWENFIIVDHKSPIKSIQMMESFPVEIRRLQEIMNMAKTLLPPLDPEISEDAEQLEAYYEPYYQRGEKEKIDVLKKALKSINHTTYGFLDKDYFSYYCGVHTEEEVQEYLKISEDELEDWKEKERVYQEDKAIEERYGETMYTETEILMMTEEERKLCMETSYEEHQILLEMSEEEVSSYLKMTDAEKKLYVENIEMGKISNETKEEVVGEVANS
jgi:hypothetical protein